MHRHWFGTYRMITFSVKIVCRLKLCFVIRFELMLVLHMPYFGNSTVIAHAGDGNFHTVILFDPSKEDHRREAERLNHFMVHTALSMEGIYEIQLVV